MGWNFALSDARALETLLSGGPMDRLQLNQKS
jgi:hypothetical protein